MYNRPNIRLLFTTFSSISISVYSDLVDEYGQCIHLNLIHHVVEEVDIRTPRRSGDHHYEADCEDTIYPVGVDICIELIIRRFPP